MKSTWGVLVLAGAIVFLGIAILVSNHNRSQKPKIAAVEPQPSAPPGFVPTSMATMPAKGDIKSPLALFPVTLPPQASVTKTVPDPAPSNPIVGKWRTSTPAGDSYLLFTQDGKIYLKNAILNADGTYTLQGGNRMNLVLGGLLVLNGVIVWKYDLNGDSMTVVEDSGVTHLYQRVIE